MDINETDFLVRCPYYRGSVGKGVLISGVAKVAWEKVPFVLISVVEMHAKVAWEKVSFLERCQRQAIHLSATS